MKFSFPFTFLIFWSLMSDAQTNDSIWVSKSKQSIHINEMEKDFGVLVQNEKTVFKFKLLNLEQEPMAVWHVTTSCGCTSPQWTEKPVKQNNEAVVKVKYDSSKLGTFNKSIYVYTTFDDKPIKLTIKGSVVASKTESIVGTRSSNFNATLPQTN